MKALVKTQKGVGYLQVKNVDVPEILDNEVLIEVAYGGICGTDIHILKDEYNYYPPIIIGHEFSGIVKSVGKNVTSFKVGDLVVGEPHNKACGKCYLCRTGNIQICKNKRSIGSGIDGAFAEYLKMSETLLHKIPNNVSLKEAALAEPTAIVAHQLIERAKVFAGDTVVIMGAGPIAIIAAKMSKSAGASKVIMCGCTVDEPVRKQVANQINAYDIFINVQTENAEEIIYKETNGIGADIVVECSGANSAIKTSVKVLKRKGRLCAIGLSGKENIEFPWNEACYKVIDCYFNMSSSYKGWEIALNLMASKKLNLEPILSVSYIDDFEDAFNKLQQGETIKTLLVTNKKYL